MNDPLELFSVRDRSGEIVAMFDDIHRAKNFADQFDYAVSLETWENPDDDEDKMSLAVAYYKEQVAEAVGHTKAALDVIEFARVVFLDRAIKYDQKSSAVENMVEKVKLARDCGASFTISEAFLFELMSIITRIKKMPSIGSDQSKLLVAQELVPDLLVYLAMWASYFLVGPKDKYDPKEDTVNGEAR